MPTEKAPIDPRSKMTDREKFMSRSLHTPRIVAIVAADIAKREGIKGPTEAVRRALRFLELPDHYSADTDPTMRKAVESTKELMGA